MKQIHFFCLYTFLCFCSPLLQGQTPANDECFNAIGLIVNPGQFCQNTTNGTTIGATLSTTVGQPDCSGGAINDDVWYKFIATSTQHVVTVNGGSPMYYPRFEGYSGTCGNLTSLGVCATATGMYNEAIFTGLSVGEAYYLRVYSSSTNTGYNGPFNICVSSFTNDECDGAVQIPLGPGCTQTYGTTRFATTSLTVGQPLCSSHTGWNDDDVWYSFTTPSSPSASYNVTLNASSFPSSNALTSPQMSIYSGSCGNLSVLSSACTQPVSGACVYNQSTNLNNLAPNTTYFIRVYSWVSASSYRGQFQICITPGNTANPLLSVSPSSLQFGSLCIGDSSVQTFTVTGSQLNSGNLTVGPLAGYQFSTNNSAYSSTVSITSCGGSLSQIVYVKFKPTAGQSYNGTISVSGGGAATVTVTVAGAGSAGVPASIPVLVSSQDTICTGGSVNLSIQSGNLNSASSWQWYSGSCGGLAAGSGPFLTVSPLNSTTYYVRGEGNCVAEGVCDSIRIVVGSGVIPAIQISSSPSGTLCFGAPVSFTAVVSNGGSNPLFEWRVNGLSVSSGGNTFTSSSLNNGDVVTCQLTSSADCAFPQSTVSNGLTLSMIPSVQPQISISADQTGSVCAGTSITFNATPLNGGSSPVYQWKINGNNFGANTSSFSTGSLTDGDVVTCLLTSSAACAIPSQVLSNSMTISVVPPATPTLTISSSAPGSICPGTSVTFTANHTEGGTNPTFQWTVNSQSLGANTSTFISNNLSNGDVVQCTMLSNASCITTASASSNTITMNVSDVIVPQVTIDSLTLPVLCRGDMVSITALTSGGGNNPSFEWYVNGVLTGNSGNPFQSSSLNHNDQLYCRMFSSESCANPQSALSNSVSLTVNEVNPSITVTDGGTSLTATQTGAQYQWISCPDFTWIAGENNISFSPSSPGSFACIVSLNNCSDTSLCESITPTGLTNLSAQGAFLIFPMPTTDVISITKTIEGQADVLFRDINGKIISKYTIDSSVSRFSLLDKGVQAGLYIVEITHPSGKGIYRVLLQ